MCDSIDGDDDFLHHFDTEWKKDQLRRQSEPAHLRQDSPHPAQGRRFSLPTCRLSQNSRIANLPQPSFVQARYDQQGTGKGSPNDGPESMLMRLDQESIPSSESDSKRVSFSNINKRLPQEVTSSREAYDAQTGTWVVIPGSSPQQAINGDIYASPTKLKYMQQPHDEHIYVNMARPVNDDQVYVTMQERSPRPSPREHYGNAEIEMTGEPQPKQSLDLAVQFRDYVKEESGMEESPYGPTFSGAPNVHTNQTNNAGARMSIASQSSSRDSNNSLPTMVRRESSLFKSMKTKIPSPLQGGGSNRRLSGTSSPGRAFAHAPSPPPSLQSPSRQYDGLSPGWRTPEGTTNMSPRAIRNLATQLGYQGYGQDSSVNRGGSRSPAGRLYNEVEGQDENMNNANEDELDLVSLMDSATPGTEEGDTASQVSHPDAHCSRSDGDLGNSDDWKFNPLRKSIESLDLTTISLEDSL